MARIETQRKPPTRERKSLALTLCALGAVLPLMIWLRPESLLVIAWVSGLAWCASMLFNRDEPLDRRWPGALVSLIAGLVYALVWYAESPATIAVAAAAALVVLGILVWRRDRFGDWFYEIWMLLFLPLAWGVSTLILVLVYYGVLTPIGIVLRIVGRDPLHRRFDRDRTSYWVKRVEVIDPERYFRQF